ncbi:MAG: hypothetical protein ACRD3R_10875, partial [Terriglobales bacterium]
VASRPSTASVTRNVFEQAAAILIALPASPGEAVRTQSIIPQHCRIQKLSSLAVGPWLILQRITR